jgi:hypothetical protein
VSNNVGLSLSDAVALAANAQPVAVPPKARAAAVEFVTKRLEQLLIDGGASPEAGARTGPEGAGRGLFWVPSSGLLSSPLLSSPLLSSPLLGSGPSGLG